MKIFQFTLCPSSRFHCKCIDYSGSSKEFRSMMLRMVMCETEQDYELLWKELNKAIVDEPMVPKKYLSGLKIEWTMTPQLMIVIDEKDKELEAALGSDSDLLEGIMYFYF